MKYDLNKLGPIEFEHMIQSLCKKIIGEGVKIYGAGPDGQREATFTGIAPYPSSAEMWDGYWVMQAKYKDFATKKGDFEWIRDNFITEMDSFKLKKKKGDRIPDNYLFFTNIVLTPVLNTGVKDKISKEKIIIRYSISFFLF